MIVVCQIFDSDNNFAGSYLGIGADLWTALSVVQERYYKKSNPGHTEQGAEAAWQALGSPNHEPLTPTPAAGASEQTAHLYQHAPNGHPSVRTALSAGSGLALAEPPPVQRPAYSADGRTVFADDGPRCAQHNVGKPSKRKGEWFCPKKVGDNYCQWVYPAAA